MGGLHLIAVWSKQPYPATRSGGTTSDEEAEAEGGRAERKPKRLWPPLNCSYRHLRHRGRQSECWRRATRDAWTSPEVTPLPTSDVKKQEQDPQSTSHNRANWDDEKDTTTTASATVPGRLCRAAARTGLLGRTALRPPASPGARQGSTDGTGGRQPGPRVVVAQAVARREGVVDPPTSAGDPSGQVLEAGRSHRRALQAHRGVVHRRASR